MAHTPNFTFPYSPITPVNNPIAPRGYGSEKLQSTSIPARQSSSYFFKDGSLSLQVGDVHYQVHAYLFERHSKVFAQKFIQPNFSAQTVVLPGVTPYDFDQLLSVLYPVNFQVFVPQTVREWASVLSLSTKWEFPSVRQLAIDHLSLIATSADKVALGRAHGVDHWLVPAYTDLCTRFEPLNMVEGDKLDKFDIIRIMGVRHTLAHDKSADVDRLVKDTFELEEGDGEVSPTPTLVSEEEGGEPTTTDSEVKAKPPTLSSLLIPGKKDAVTEELTPVNKKKRRAQVIKPDESPVPFLTVV